MIAANCPSGIAVSAVILTYRRQDLLPACLESVRSALARVDEPTEIVVVDNASPQNAATRLIGEICPQARIVTLTANRGYAGGLHAGLDACGGAWILTIGDDATIDSPAVAAMLSAGRSGDDVGSVAAKMLFADRSNGDVVNSAGLDIDRLGTAVDRLVGAPSAQVPTRTTEVFGTSGGAALYRRAMLDAIGGFDVSFGVYLEDADVAWRAQMAGWRCLLEPTAVVHHHHSATTRHRSDYKYFHVGRNRVRMLAKNATLGHLLRYGPLIVLYDLAYVAYALAVDRTTAPIRGRIQGLREWRHYRADPSGRRSVQLTAARGVRQALARSAAVHASGSTGSVASAAPDRAASDDHGDGRATIDAVFLTNTSRAQALECIANLHEPEIASIVMVDNASSDDTVQAVRTAHPDVTVVELRMPHGIAAALNRGAERGHAPFVLYLNDDVYAAAGSIRRLLDTLRAHPESVAVGGRLCERDLSTQDRYRPRRFPTPAVIVARVLGLDRLWPRNPLTGGHLRRLLDDDATVEVDQPAGACLLVRRPIAERIGGWDERYHFWYEDVDFSARLAEHGSQLYVPSAPFRHIGGSTVKRMNRATSHHCMFHGMLLYAQTHFSARGRIFVSVALATIGAARAVTALPRDLEAARVYAAITGSAIGVLAGRRLGAPDLGLATQPAPLAS